MTKLSQEWSLLSPRTAFLVLEKESDYARWDINRKRRRRYWKPVEMLAAIPIPDELKLVADAALKTDPAPVRIGRNRYTLDDVREVIRRGDWPDADLVLRAVSPLGQADEYRKLQQQIRAALNQRKFVANHDGLAGWFNRNQYRPIKQLLPRTANTPYGSTSPEFEHLFPWAPKLLKKVSGIIPPMNGDTLIEWIGEHSGMPVLEDRLALDELQIESLGDINFWGLNLKNPMTVRNAIYHIFNRADGVDEPLTMLTKPSALVITTQSEADAEENYTTKLYHIHDLLDPNRAPRSGDLVNPILDTQAEFQNRVKRAWSKPIRLPKGNLGLELREWTEVFADHFGETVLLDRLALDELQIEADDVLTNHHAGKLLSLIHI